MTEMPSEIFALPQQSSLYTHTLGSALALAKESILYSLGPRMYVVLYIISQQCIYILPPFYFSHLSILCINLAQWHLMHRAQW